MMYGQSSFDEVDHEMELALKLSLEFSQNDAQNYEPIAGPSGFSNALLKNRKRPVEMNDQNPSSKKLVTSKTDEDYLLALKLFEEINQTDLPVSNINDDFALALQLEKENKSSTPIILVDNNDENEDYLLAIQLQKDFQPNVIPVNSVVPAKSMVSAKSNNSLTSKPPSQSNERNYDDENISVIDPSWETIDPVPDIYALFAAFNKRFFWGKLESVEVKWSPRMTQCAGICSYSPRAGFCSVRLSQPLLKFRPRKDLVETMLHEMIHAFLFVTRNDRDRDGHGPRFCEHMNRINEESGAHITIYHSFHEEVKHYKTHWWKCNGPCQHKPPYFGILKRSTNRAPGPNDFWWNDHRATCGGEYVKVKEPEDYTNKKQKKNYNKKAPVNVLNNYFPSLGATSSHKPSISSSASTFFKQSTSTHQPVGFKKYPTVPTNSASSTPANPNRGQKILSLVDLNVKKHSNQNSDGKSNFVPLSDQKNIFHFINDNDWS